MTLTVGSLFSGYGGLDLAAESIFQAETAWHAEFEPGPSQILANHWPGIPNLGDVTQIDWAHVEPVDIITGGSPCQDLSAAGRRAGMTDGTRSNLWVQMREAIANVKPGYVVWENVRGAFSAHAASGVEFCPGCMGAGGGKESHLRALGRVLGDLSDLGFNARWIGLRAADIGACHSRFRVFVLAERRTSIGDTGRLRGVTGWLAERRGAETSRPRSGTSGPTPRPLLPTPTVVDRDNRSASPNAALRYGLRNIDKLLPTPKTTDNNTGGRADLRRHDPGLRALHLLLPTPTVGDKGGEAARSSPGFGRPLGEVVRTLGETFGEYAPAVARHTELVGRMPPPPTELGPRGGRRLSAPFVEWMMCLPPGFVTQQGIPRTAQLKALGNGVLPLQAMAALEALLDY